MRVSALTARHIENSRAYRQLEEIDEARRIMAIALGCKE